MTLASLPPPFYYVVTYVTSQYVSVISLIAWRLVPVKWPYFNNLADFQLVNFRAKNVSFH